MSACKEDENAEPDIPNNTIVYDGNELLIKDAGIKDVKHNPYFPDYYFYNIFLTDRKLTLYENSDLIGMQGYSFSYLPRWDTPTSLTPSKT